MAYIPGPAGFEEHILYLPRERYSSRRKTRTSSGSSSSSSSSSMLYFLESIIVLRQPIYLPFSKQSVGGTCGLEPHQPTSKTKTTAICVCTRQQVRFIHMRVVLIRVHIRDFADTLTGCGDHMGPSCQKYTKLDVLPSVPPSGPDDAIQRHCHFPSHEPPLLQESARPCP